MTTSPPPYPGSPQPLDPGHPYQQPVELGHPQHPHQQPYASVPPASAAPPAPTFDRPEDFPTTVSNDGRLGWALSLVSVVGFPGACAIVCGIAMIIGGLMQRRKNPWPAAPGAMPHSSAPRWC